MPNSVVPLSAPTLPRPVGLKMKRVFLAVALVVLVVITGSPMTTTQHPLARSASSQVAIFFAGRHASPNHSNAAGATYSSSLPLSPSLSFFCESERGPFSSPLSLFPSPRRKIGPL